MFSAIVGPKKGEAGEPLNKLYISYDEVIYTSFNVTVLFFVFFPKTLLLLSGRTR